MNELAGVEPSTNVDRVFTALLHEVAQEETPRFFAIVEEYGNAEDAHVAGYGLS